MLLDLRTINNWAGKNRQVLWWNGGEPQKLSTLKTVWYELFSSFSNIRRRRRARWRIVVVWSREGHSPRGEGTKIVRPLKRLIVPERWSWRSYRRTQLGGGLAAASAVAVFNCCNASGVRPEGVDKTWARAHGPAHGLPCGLPYGLRYGLPCGPPPQIFFR